MNTFRVDVQDGDIEFVKEFDHQVKMLAGMVNEMFNESPKMLLSPVMRELLSDKAKQVDEMRTAMFSKSVYVDNPTGKPLAKKPEAAR